MSASLELYLGVDIPLMEELGTLGRLPDGQGFQLAVQQQPAGHRGVFPPSHGSACASITLAQDRATTAARSVSSNPIYIAHVTVIDTETGTKSMALP